MTDQNKPETPEEFLKKQMEREQSAQEAATKAQQDRNEQAARALEGKHKAIADRILATWRQTVEKAGEQQAGVRFAVLADLSDSGHWQGDSHIGTVVNALATAGWSAEVVSLTQRPGQRAQQANPNEPQAGPVEYKAMRGWRLDGTPKFGEHFFTQGNTLIVRWFPT